MKRAPTQAFVLFVAAGLVASPPARGEEEAPFPFEPKFTYVPISFGVSSFSEMSDLNAELRREGYGELARLVPTVSVSLAASFANGLMLAPQYRFAIVAASESTLTLHHFTMNVGYEVIRTERQLLVPYLGGGFGLANLEIVSPALQSTTFRSVLHNPRYDATLNSSTFILQGGVTAHLWGSGHGDFFGLSTGLTVAPISAGWKQRGVSAVGGPSPPMSGGYFGAVVGFAFPMSD